MFNHTVREDEEVFLATGEQGVRVPSARAWIMRKMVEDRREGEEMLAVAWHPPPLSAKSQNQQRGGWNGSMDVGSS